MDPDLGRIEQQKEDRHYLELDHGGEEECCPECGGVELDGVRSALGSVHPELLRCTDCETVFWPGGERA